MLKRTICMLLSITLLMGSFGIMYIHAENDSEQTIQAVSPEAVEATTTASTPEVINITSGSVLLELGKTYQLVHDNVDIVNLYSFSSAITIMGTNTIRADEIGSTYLSIGYYNDNNVLSLLSCQIEILDISGTIDLAKSNVFVEKGKNYWLIHSEETPSSISTMNHNVINLTNGVRVLVAVDTGTTNLSYNYTKDGSNVSGVCKVDVYETLDIDSYKNNSTDNFYIALSSGYGYEAYRYAITYNQENTQAYPILQYPNYSRYVTQEFRITQQSDGYCYIYSPNNHSFLVVNDSEPTLTSEIFFTSSPSFTGNQVYKWKFLNNGTSLLLIPEGGEDAQLFLSCNGSLRREKKFTLQPYSETSAPKNWELYNSNVYINNYYDTSLCDEVGLDHMVVNAIFYANDFANTVFGRYYPSMRVNMKLGPTYTSDSPADKCTTGVDNPCDGVLCGSSHPHKTLMNTLSFARANLPRKNNEITVLWSDRDIGTFCLHTTSGCQSKSAVGWTDASQEEIRLCIQILSIRKAILQCYGNIALTNEDIIAYASIVLAHEITHSLGSGDHYERESHIGANETEYDQSLQCIMEAGVHPSLAETFYQEVILGRSEPICDDCYNDWSNMNMSFFKGNYN